MRRNKMMTKGIVYSMAATMLITGAPINAHAAEAQAGEMPAAEAMMDSVMEVHPIQVTVQPEDVVAKAGDSVSFHVEAKGEGLTYQWYKFTGGSSWQRMSSAGAKTDTVSFTAKDSFDGMCLYCYITDKDGATFASDMAVLTVQQEIKQEPSYSIDKIDVWQYILIEGTDTEVIKQTLLTAIEDASLDLTAELTSIQFIDRNENSETLVIEKDIVDTVLNKMGFTNEDTGRIVKFILDDVEISYSTLASASEANSHDMFYKNLADHLAVAHALEGAYGKNLPVGVCYGPAVSSLPAGKEMMMYGKSLPVKDGEYFYCYSFDGQKFTLEKRYVVQDVTNGQSWFHAYVSDNKTYIMVNEELDESVVVKAANPVQIVAQPSDVSVTEGETITLCLTAEGEGLTYQWYKCPMGAEKWAKMSSTGCKTDTITFKATESVDGMVCYCEVTDANGNMDMSDMVILNVAPAVKVIEQPISQYVAAGTEVSFSFKANTTNVSYQWQKYTNGKWVNSSSAGAKTDTIVMTTKESYNGLKFRCKITNNAGKSYYTNAAELKVTAAAKVTSQPVDTIVKAGQTATFTVAATGEGLTYQWLKNTGDKWVNSSSTGAKTATLSIPTKASYDGLVFICMITDATGAVTYSDAVCLTVTTAITEQPQSVSVTAGANATFTVKASGKGLTYQWQKQNVGSTSWVNSGSTGAKTNTLQMTTKASYNGLKFRCKITDANGVVTYSDAASLTVQK